MTISNVIYLMGNAPLQEKIAAAIVNPGNILERNSSDEVLKHATAAGANSPVLVAVENSLAGKGTGDAYASGDTVIFIAPRIGDHVNLLGLASEVFVEGALLESDGVGRVRILAAVTATVLEGGVVGRALETITPGSDALIKAEIA